MLILPSSITCAGVKQIARGWAEAAESESATDASSSTRNVWATVQTGAAVVDVVAAFVAFVLRLTPTLTWEESELRRAVRQTADGFFHELADPSTIDADGNVSPNTLTYRVLDSLLEWGEELDSPEPRSWVDEFVKLRPMQRATAIRAVNMILTANPRPAVSPSEQSPAVPTEVTRVVVPLAMQVDDGEDLAAVLSELEALPGLAPVKQQIREDLALQQVNLERQQRALQAPLTSRHMVFLGNPGTGKTTVARLVARAYKAAGILSSGHVIETDRGGLVSEFVGQTAQKTRAVIDTARDGVLFVDEAYALAGTVERGPDQHAQEAVDTLVKAMEDERDRLVVIFAGYPAEMQRFLDMNSGLRSRIGRTVTFPDYGIEELQDIAAGMTESAGMHVDAAASALLGEHLERCGALLGNARDVRNIMDAVIRAQALRISGDLKAVSNDELCTLTACDMKQALPVFPISVPVARPIGFTSQGAVA